MDLETYYRVVTVILTGLIGLCVGSFLNVVIYRVPLGMSVAKPASHCPQCNYMLKWYDNVPVFSYAFLGGRCRNCRCRISPRYTVVEIGNMLLWLACLWRFGMDGWRDIVCAATAAVACSVCLCVAFIDWEHQLIFDRFQIILGVMAIGFTVADTGTAWWSHLIGGAAGFLLFFGVGALFSHLLGQEALGGGDIKFAGVAGLFLGWERFLLMLLLSSVSASVSMLIRRRREADGERKTYPFGPFLTVGFAVALLFGSFIISTYLHLLGLE